MSQRVEDATAGGPDGPDAPDGTGSVRYALGRLGVLPGLVTLFVVLGTLEYVFDLLAGSGSSGSLSAAFGYVLQLLVLYGATVGFLSLDDRTFPERLAGALVRLPGLVPLALAALVANALVEVVVVRFLPPLGGFEPLVAPVVVPLLFSRFLLAFPAVALDTDGLVTGLRRSLRLSGVYAAAINEFALLYAATTATPVLLSVLGTGYVQGTGGRLLVALGGFLGILVVAPLSVALARLYRDVSAAGASSMVSA